MTSKRTTVLVILDGWGIAREDVHSNPMTSATAPHYFSLLSTFAHAELQASGVSVGLFKGQEGNSEAGHLNIGAGRVVKQDAQYVSDAISDGTFFKNDVLRQTLLQTKEEGGAVHLMGLLSNHNSAHSNPEHLYALLDLCHQEGVEKIFLHLFTDGRDSGQHDALHFLKDLQGHLYGTEKIATIMGRLYGMDRNKNWERTLLAYQALTEGKGRMAESAEEAITIAYNSGESDEFVKPTIIGKKGKPTALVQEKDAIFFFNLRSDRTRQLTKTFAQPQFEEMNADSFKRAKVYKRVRFVTMTDYGPDLPNVLTAYPSHDVKNGLVPTLCPLKQLYVAESEKFAHITYFLNGGYAQHFCDERWVKIASDTVLDFERDPEMKSKEIVDYVIAAIEGGEYDFIAVNIANADMVGHTGNFAAAERAITAVDIALSRLTKAMKEHDVQGVITADHGNVEEMVNMKTGEIDSEHSTNSVPCIIIGSKKDYTTWHLAPGKKLHPGKLADVAPTLLHMMGIAVPKEMTGKSLIA